MPGAIYPSQEVLDELGKFYNRRRLLVSGMIGDKLQEKADEREDKIIEWPELPPKPTGFMRDPMIIGGSKDFARAARRVFDTAPRAKENIESVMIGPTKESMDAMTKSKMPMSAFEGTNLGGIISSPLVHPQRIGLNPGVSERALLEILMHEIAHGSGYGLFDDKEADQAIGIFKRLEPEDKGRKIKRVNLK